VNTLIGIFSNNVSRRNVIAKNATHIDWQFSIQKVRNKLNRQYQSLNELNQKFKQT
jgi:hypothetical protein